MGCYYHDGVEDVAICPQCGKKLCRGCASLTVGGVCYNCAMQSHLNVQKTFKTDLILAIICSIVFITSLILMYFKVEYSALGIVIIGIVPAWRFLTWLANTILPPRVYAIWLYILLTIVKAIIAFFLSAIVPIIYIIKVIVNIAKFKATKKEIEILNSNFNSI